MELWLKDSEHSKKEAQSLIERLNSSLRKTLDNEYAERRPKEWITAAYEIQKQWFQVSIGLDFEGDHETLFLTDVKNAYLVGNNSIFSFTHWLGSLYAELRDAALKGKYPEKIAYGPPDKNGRPPSKQRPVGPLSLYEVLNSRITNVKFFTALADKLIQHAEITTEEGPATARAALRPIWLSVDPTQNENYRWPFHGEYILTGGPGTGKTSIALLRIPFLIQEQRNKDMQALMPDGYKPQKDGEKEIDFFTEHNMLVIVWEKHLEPYLQESLRELRFTDVPVHHYDRWLNEQLRRFVYLGGSHYKIQDDVARWSKIKKSITESDLNEWIASWGEHENLLHPIALEAYQKMMQGIQHLRRKYKLVRSPNDKVEESWEVLRNPIERQRFRYTEQGLKVAGTRIRDYLNEFKKRCEYPEPISRSEDYIKEESDDEPENPQMRTERRLQLLQSLPDLIESITEIQTEQIELFPHRFPRLLNSFYSWVTEKQVVSGMLSAEERKSFLDYLDQRFQHHLLSKLDRVLILWIIQLIAEKTETPSLEGESLPSFSHVMVDEAQQYDPLILRLFRRLARKPFNSITLVGDLKQRLREDGGVVVWDDLGLPIPEDRRRELLVNYRWSKHTFESLQLLAKVLQLNVQLQPPLRWTSGEGVKSNGFISDSFESEVDEISQRISQLLLRSEANRWAIALLIPSEYTSKKSDILNSLEASAINARWAEEADIRAGKEGVTVTNSASVVGLEFDAVFILGTQHFLPGKATVVQKQTMWVMATRARQYLCISAVGKVKVLEDWISLLDKSHDA